MKSRILSDRGEELHREWCFFECEGWEHERERGTAQRQFRGRAEDQGPHPRRSQILVATSVGLTGRGKSLQLVVEKGATRVD